MKRSRALVLQLQLVLAFAGAGIKRVERDFKAMQPATVVYRTLGVPAAVRQHIERAAKTSVAVLVPAVEIHRHTRPEPAQRVAKLVSRVGGDAGDANESFIDEGMALKVNRLRRSDPARHKQDRRHAGSEIFPGSRSARMPHRKLI